MAKQTQNNEKIVAALICSNSVREAAKVVGVTERTIYESLKDNDFLLLYEGAKAEVLRGAVYNLNSQLTNAVDTIAEVMNNPEVNPAVRLQAANALLTHASKLVDRLETSEAYIARVAKSLDNEKIFPSIF